MDNLPTTTPKTKTSTLAKWVDDAITLLNTTLTTTINNLIATCVLLAGRVGGQIIHGGTGSGEDIELKSTSHVTKGKIILGILVVDEVTGEISINTSTPDSILHIHSDSSDIVKILTLAVMGSNGRPRLTFTNPSGSWFYEINGTNFEINRTGSGGTRELVLTDTGALGLGVNNPNASAQLDVASTTKGFLPPRMTTTQRDAISSPEPGLIIYNKTTQKHQGRNNVAWNDLY